MELHNELRDDQSFLDKLIIGIGEVSEITKVPTRQIRYWEDKGYISSLSAEGKNRRYNYLNIKKILLIKELIDEGYTLEASVIKVENRIKMVNEALNKFKKH
jgi:DNA-binding transcriptional MerR regulator